MDANFQNILQYVNGLTIGNFAKRIKFCRNEVGFVTADECTERQKWKKQCFDGEEKQRKKITLNVVGNKDYN